jgi:ectoine hydroxylase-related dioxygenase (phytanoyl-CoA dioxygenase family)
MATAPDTSTDAALEALATDGFVVLPGPLPSAELARLQMAYDSAAQTANPSDVRTGRTSTRITDFVNREPIFECLYTWPVALDAARRVVGTRFRLSAFHARTLHPGAPAQELHVDVPRTSDAWPMLGLIFMVDDFRPDNGATRFIPGSLQRTELPSSVLADLTAPPSAEVLACGPAGHVILFDASTWHGHTRNSSRQPRRSLQATFIPQTGRPATDFGARMLPQRLAHLSPIARTVLGIEPVVGAPPESSAGN